MVGDYLVGHANILEEEAEVKGKENSLVQVDISLDKGQCTRAVIDTEEGTIYRESLFMETIYTCVRDGLC